ncbi:MAG: FitA-like ribbon-helix-helix domain-containing protein [Gemmatimonadota bacterium]
MSKMIQLRNVPDELHRRLKARAAQNGQTLSDFLIGEIKAIAERPTPAEIRYRLSQRSPLAVRESAVRAVRAERDAR